MYIYIYVHIYITGDAKYGCSEPEKKRIVWRPRIVCSLRSGLKGTLYLHCIYTNEINMNTPSKSFEGMK